MRVLFAGTPDFAVPALQALAKEHDIIGVFTQPDRKSGRGKKMMPPAVKVAALEIGTTIFQPESLRDQTQLIADLSPDVMVVVAYGMLLPQSILDIPRHGCINIHASILPRWRGAAPIHRAIEAGDRESGVSIMRMELGLDTGPVYQVLKTPIEPNDTSSSLHDKLADLGAEGICGTLTRLVNAEQAEPTPQNDALATYAKKLKKDEAIIDWSMSAKEIDQRIRAFVPWPICQCQHQQTRLRVWQANVVDHDTLPNDGIAPGTIRSIQALGVVVQCGSGQLRLEILQRDGSKAMPWQQFANGYSLSTNDQLL